MHADLIAPVALLIIGLWLMTEGVLLLVADRRAKVDRAVHDDLARAMAGVDRGLARVRRRTWRSLWEVR